MSIVFRLESYMRAYENEADVRYTIREWAEVLDLSVNFLHRMKHGELRYLDLAKLAALCAFFGCTPNDLLWADDKEEKEDGE